MTASKLNQRNVQEEGDGSSYLGRLLKRLVLFFIAYLLLYQLWVLMHVWWWVDHNPSQTAFMKSRLSSLQQKKPGATLKHQWLAYPKLSTNLKKAVIASEDAKFMQHDGFDWEGMKIAFDKNIKERKIKAGGSTISQQLAKNLFLSSKRTPWRKIQEAIITVMLEKMMDKKRIYEIYLNVIEWGDGVFGAQAASQHYYHKSARNLSSVQAAKLAVMVPNPRYYDQHRNTKYLNKRMRTIQARMRVSKIPK